MIRRQPFSVIGQVVGVNEGYQDVDVQQADFGQPGFTRLHRGAGLPVRS
jgi:hypothetical protein